MAIRKQTDREPDTEGPSTGSEEPTREALLGRIEELERTNEELSSLCGDLHCEVSGSRTSGESALEARILERTTAANDYQRQLQSIIETAEDGIITIDSTGTIDIFNSAAERIFGYSRREVVGRNVKILMPDAVAAEHDGYIARYLETGVGKVIGRGREVFGRRKDGGEVPLDIRVGSFEDGRFSGFVRDLTERKQLEAEYMQAQKMEAIGRLAGGVAHDFNNLLAGILGGLRIAMTYIGNGHAALPMLSEVRQEVTRGAAITRRLLDFSRSATPDPRPVNPCEIVHAAERMIRRLLGEDIRVRIDCRTAGSLVCSDPGMIEQAVINLAINARDAMPRGGELRIECSDAKLSVADTERLGCVGGPGPYVILSVIDTGTGMDDETMRKATEAFFTTKEAGMGTGLGLASVDAMVKGLDGALELESAIGVGTTVRMYLPRAVALERQRVPAAEPDHEPACGGETILVVEDEKLVRLGIQHLLQELGYEVLTAKDPDEALEELRARGSELDLLLTDVLLPGMSGPELAVAAKKIAPGLPALFMSAFPREELEAQGRIEPGTATLEKPFGSRDVITKVRAALATAPDRRT